MSRKKKKRKVSFFTRQFKNAKKSFFAAKDKIFKNKILNFFYVLLTFFALVFGFWNDIREFATQIIGVSPVFVEISFFEEKDGVLSIINPYQVPILIELDAIENQEIPIPINIAVRNLGEEPLNVVRVELSYDKNLRIRSEGNPLIDPSGETIVYTHELNTLQPIEYFTPLETIDTIYVPYTMFWISTFSWLKYDFPYYHYTLVSLDGEKFMRGDSYSESIKVVEFDIRVFSENRKPATGKIRMNIKPSIDIFLGNLIPLEDIQGQESGFTPIDYDTFSRLPTENVELIDEWKIFDELAENTLEYKKLEHFSSTYQYILVNERIRRVIVDVDNNGYVDYELEDVYDTGVLNMKYSYGPEDMMMFDWDTEALGEEGVINIP